MLTINPTSHEGYCYAFMGKDIVLKSNGKQLDFADMKVLHDALPCENIFTEHEIRVCAMKISRLNTTSSSHNDCALPSGYTSQPLRIYNTEQPQEEVMRTLRAKALAEWLSNTHCCSKCGKNLLPHPSLTAMQCFECKTIVFPRIEPCIIVLVSKGKEILLARHAQRNQDIYACIAGFMEAGESAEQCVEREIMEETGIRVKNIKYFGSQSWPFPSQLMIAFTAEYESGELKLQEDEISDAGWFSPDNCPATPQPGSIAYRMIQAAKGNM